MSSAVLRLLLVACGAAIAAAGWNPTTPPFISEFHTDNVGTDIGEFIEVSHTNKQDWAFFNKWCVILINGYNKKVYDRRALGMAKTGSRATYVVDFQENGIQNGPADCLAIAECATAPTDNQLVTAAVAAKFSQLICYEGEVNFGGVIGKDIGVKETSSTPVGHSFQACPGQLGGNCWRVAANTRRVRNT